MEGINPCLRRGFFRVDCHFIIEGSLIEVYEVGGCPSSPGGTVSSIVSHLSTFEACVVVSTWGRLGDAVSCRSSLSSPLVRSPRTAEVHGNGSVVKCRRGG